MKQFVSGTRLCGLTSISTLTTESRRIACNRRIQPFRQHIRRRLIHSRQEKTLIKPDTLIFGRRLTMKVRHGLSNAQHAAHNLTSGTETKWYAIRRIIILSAFMRKYDSEIRYHPRTGHEGPEEKKSYSSTLSLTPALNVGAASDIHSHTPGSHLSPNSNYSYWISVSPSRKMQGQYRPERLHFTP